MDIESEWYVSFISRDVGKWYTYDKQINTKSYNSVNGCAYLSTSVLMTASVSSTKLSTFCFFLLGSWGPRPRRGGLTGSLGRLLLASPASTTTPVPWSTRLACPRAALDDPCWWSSKSLSSRHTQLLPMVPVLETTEAKVSQTVRTEFERER